MMMEEKAFEEKSLRELEQANNPVLVAKYHETLALLGEDREAKEMIEKYYGESINSIYHRIEKYHYETVVKNTSEVLFPGQVVKVYPGIKTPTAKRMITCDFSGGRIYPGSKYVSYRPMIRNIYNGTTYVLSKTIRVESGYEWDLPTTIAELDALQLKIEKADIFGTIDGIDYTHLAQCTGGDLSFQKLKRRKRYEIRICK